MNAPMLAGLLLAFVLAAGSSALLVAGLARFLPRCGRGAPR